MQIYSSLKEKIGHKLHLTRNIIPKAMLETIKEYQKKSIKEGHFFLLTSEYMMNLLSNPKINLKTKEYFFNLCKDWDDIGSIPLELGQEIERLINDPNVTIGIHRTRGSGVKNILEDSIFKSIFNEGLINPGHLSNGAIINGVIDPSKTISSFTSVITATIYLKTCYKDSIGGVLVAFPSTLVDKDMNLTSPSSAIIYNNKNDILYIKPEYLLGFVEQHDGICTYYPKEAFQKERVI